MSTRPNVILINCDDLGYGDLGCYGATANHTPAIDRLAREGLRFTGFYASSPVCSPSRAGLMTGCYPPRVDMPWVLFPGDAMGLHPGEYTLPRLFKDAGYATMMVGKWHLGDQRPCLPTRFGFDEYYGLPYSNDMGRQALPDGGEDDRPPLPLLQGEEVIEEQPDQRGLTERYVERAVSFIRAHREEPFFLYFAHMHVHLPLYAAQPFVDASQNGDYGACVAAIDWSVAALTAELKARGLYENTMILFTSDNGSRADHGASNAPLRGNKATVWEGGLRVPLIASWPGRIPPGETDALCANIDLLPTLAALLGRDLPARGPLDGVDIGDVLLGGGGAGRETFCYYHRWNLAAFRSGDWKLHLSRGGQPVCALYNLREDLSETQDRAAERPDVVVQLTREAHAVMAELGDEMRGIAGAAIRRGLYADDPRPLTQYDENHPYIIALYDKMDRG